MSVALARAKQEIDAAKNRTAGITKRLKADKSHYMVLGAHAVGTGASAVGTALVDAKFGQEGEPAEFGNSGIPINATVGAVVLVTGVILSKKHPVTGAFLAQGGLFACGNWLNHVAKSKFLESE